MIQLVRLSNESGPSRVTAGAILAAGHGTRLNSKSGKPLAEIGGKPLIAHVIEQFLEAGVRELFVALRRDDEALVDYLGWIAAQRHFSCVHVVALSSESGTGTATRELMLAIGPRSHLLSTVDLIAPRFLAERLCAEARSFDGDLLSVLATSSYVHDETPVWVRQENGSSVTSFGKDTAPTAQVFGNIRWVSGRALSVLAEMPAFWQAKRDTEIVRLMIAARPEGVIARRYGVIHDVDRVVDREAAEDWFRDSVEFDCEAPTQRFTTIVGKRLAPESITAGRDAWRGRAVSRKVISPLVSLFNASAATLRRG